MVAPTPMSAAATSTHRLSARPSSASPAADRASAWLLGFAPTTYLALSGGGYDIVARSEIAVVLWWLLLLGAVVGLLPRRRIGSAGWVALLLLAAFLAWSWLALGWTESREQTLVEIGRLAAYLGVLALGLATRTRRSAIALLAGLASAIGLVSLLADLSRLIPSLFPADTAASFYATSRLAYPFDYSDAVGEFAALGLPLLLLVATEARTLAARALAAAGLPAVVLCLALTVSRGGIFAAAVGVAAFFVLMPDRIPRLATGLAAAVAGALMMLELLSLPGVRDALVRPAPAGQRGSMLLVLVLACLGLAAFQVAFTALRRRRARPRWLAVSRRMAASIGAGLAVLVVAVVVVAFASGAVGHLWREFKEPNPPVAGNQYFRLLSVAGSHRYQYWQAASAAFHTSPWKGIGPGTFQYWWATHDSLHEFVRNAHSLWVETLAELGIVGLALIGGLFAFALVAGTRRALRSAEWERAAVATAVAAIAAFCAAAAFDWVWQIGVIPLVAMLLLAVALGGQWQGRRRRSSRRRRQAVGVALVAGAVVCLWRIALPLATTLEVRSSQAAAARGDFTPALADAATARGVEPDAASPWLQQALVLEQLGDIRGARSAIAQAERLEPVNWQIWLVASRLATEADRPRLALALYRRAKALNPSSPIFGG